MLHVYVPHICPCFTRATHVSAAHFARGLENSSPHSQPNPSSKPSGNNYVIACVHVARIESCGLQAQQQFGGPAAQTPLFDRRPVPTGQNQNRCNLAVKSLGKIGFSLGCPSYAPRASHARQSWTSSTASASAQEGPSGPAAPRDWGVSAHLHKSERGEAETSRQRGLARGAAKRS